MKRSLKKIVLETTKAKKKEFMEEIKRATSMVLELEGDGAKCGKCLLPNHTA